MEQKQLKQKSYYYPQGEPIKYEREILGRDKNTIENYSIPQLVEDVILNYDFPEQSDKTSLEHNLAHSRIIFAEGKRLFDICNHVASSCQTKEDQTIIKNTLKCAIKLLIASVGWYDNSAIDECLTKAGVTSIRVALNDEEWKSVEHFAKSIEMLRLKYMTIQQTVQFVKDKYHDPRLQHMEDLSTELVVKGRGMIEFCRKVKKDGEVVSEKDKERWQNELNLGVKYLLASLYEKNDDAIAELSKCFEDSILEMKEDKKHINDIIAFVKEQKRTK